MQLSELKIQYADYAIWQRNNLVGELFEKKLSYWKNKLENVAPIQLPTDYKRPPIWSSRGAFVNSKIDKDLAHQIVELSQKKELPYS